MSLTLKIVDNLNKNVLMLYIKKRIIRWMVKSSWLDVTRYVSTTEGIKIFHVIVI